MTKFSARALSPCFPLCRIELFEEVCGKHQSEDVTNVWIVPGHVFITLNNGTKLLTFDCQSVTYQHHLSSGVLDIPVMQSPVIDILISSSLFGLTFIVLEDGHVHCWLYSHTQQWSPLAEFNLGQSDGTKPKITNICLHPKHNALYWCEQQAKRTGDFSWTFSICKIQLPDKLEKLKERKIRETTKVMNDCLLSDVLPMGDGLLVVPKYQDGVAKVSVLLRKSVMEMVSVTIVIGDMVQKLSHMRSPVAFSSIMVNCLPTIKKVSVPNIDYGIKRDSISGNAVMLLSDGTAQMFQMSEDASQESLKTHLIRINLSDWFHRLKSHDGFWCFHRNILSFVADSDTVRLHGLNNGELLQEIKTSDGGFIKQMTFVTSPALVAAFITKSGLSIIQGSKTKSNTLMATPGGLLQQDKHFQTDALQVALLTKHREENPSELISKQIAALHDKWLDVQTQHPRTQLSQTVDSYLAEFWRLEELGNSVETPLATPLSPVIGIEELVRDAVARSQSITPDAAFVELLWLSQKYPVILLDNLLGGLDVDKEPLTPADHALWQACVGMESSEYQTSTPNGAMTFELICRLLYQERPHSLVSFVRNVQHVSDQSVAVSAFVRKKHLLQYYARAMECLLEVTHSVDLQQATLAKAEILHTGGAEHGPELALRFLLQHNQWFEAINLLRKLSKNTPQHVSLFFLLIQELVQNQVFSDYASDAFSLLPSWKSFLAVVKVIDDCPDAQYSQMTAPRPTMYYSGPPDIPLSALRPHLMSLLQ